MLETCRPMDIEARSFEIITELLGERLLSAGVQKTDGKGWIGVKMKVRKARVERIGCDGAGPAPAGRLFGSKIAAGLICVPVVKFMGRNRLPRAAKEVILRSGKRHVAEAGELACGVAAARQHACHRAAADCLGQIHETAALGDARKPRADCFADALAHGFVLG